MELRVLRYFLMVAKEESISAAANRLHVTQPTLSRQLIELEEELGTKLLNRGGRNKKITLTEEGVFLRRRAEEIIELADRTEADFAAPGTIISGDVYIGAGETDAMRIVARTAQALKEKYPHIRYHLYSGNADDVSQRLDQGLLDFGILIEPANIDKYDYIRLPVTDTWGVLMRRDHPLAEKEYICAEDLEGLPLLASRQSAVGNMLAGWMGMDPEKLHFVASYNLIYNASLMVREGFGCAICLDKLIHEADDTICFRPFSPRLETNLNLVWKKHPAFSKAAEKFLEQLQMELHGTELLK